MNKTSELARLIPASTLTESCVQLVCNERNSVQPNILLRAPVFTPAGRPPSKDFKLEEETLDVSDCLNDLELCKTEGYDQITIKGPKLNIETDFKVWCGIIFSLTKYGKDGNKIVLSFTEFAKLCGYPAKRFDKNLRIQIGNSLNRIQNQKLRFLRKGSGEAKGVATGLLLRAEYDADPKVDKIELIADESLWDLYKFDYQILVSLEVLSLLPRSEVAQSLYLYFLSLPLKPHPISFTRLRERLQLNTSDYEANRRINLALKKLRKIRFLDYSVLTKNRERYVLLEGRSNKLALPELID